MMLPGKLSQFCMTAVYTSWLVTIACKPGLAEDMQSVHSSGRGPNGSTAQWCPTQGQPSRGAGCHMSTDIATVAPQCKTADQHGTFV